VVLCCCWVWCLSGGRCYCLSNYCLCVCRKYPRVGKERDQFMVKKEQRDPAHSQSAPINNQQSTAMPRTKRAPTGPRQAARRSLATGGRSAPAVNIEVKTEPGERRQPKSKARPAKAISKHRRMECAEEEAKDESVELKKTRLYLYMRGHLDRLFAPTRKMPRGAKWPIAKHALLDYYALRIVKNIGPNKKKGIRIKANFETALQRRKDRNALRNCLKEYFASKFFPCTSIDKETFMRRLQDYYAFNSTRCENEEKEQMESLQRELQRTKPVGPASHCPRCRKKTMIDVYFPGAAPGSCGAKPIMRRRSTCSSCGYCERE
jgi:hypothetical protein